MISDVVKKDLAYREPEDGESQDLPKSTRIVTESSNPNNGWQRLSS
jgi:hypothetical protein